MQLAELREYAARRGWEVFSEYVDSGISGSKESRPELNRLMADAHRRNFDVVLCWKVDRFGRSLKHLVNALADLDSYGDEVVKLPKGDNYRRHYLRPRAVYFDNKNENFSVFVDYLFPKDAENNVLTPQQLNEVLRDGEGLYSDGAASWYTTNWDVRYVETNQISDHFHLDHKEYYEPFLEQYRFGFPRSRFLSDLR